MRTLESKYDGVCAACGADLPVGSTIGYEKATGTFCPACIPTDTEEIRAYRQAKIDRKNERREGWAQARERKAAEAQGRSDTLMGRDRSEDGRADWALVSQPGYIPQRAQANRAQERAWQEAAKADEHRSKMIGPATVKGDAERRREAKRDVTRGWIRKGMRVTSVFVTGEVIRVNKKTATLRLDSGSTWREDLSFIPRPKGVGDDEQ